MRLLRIHRRPEFKPFCMKNLFSFDFSNIKGDLFGGLTAGIVALPLALAFGVQSGMGAAAGLYGAFIIGTLAAFFGGTPTQISGPTAPMTVISAILVAKIVQANNGDLETAIPAILIVFLLAGVIEALLGVFGIGKYIKYIPYPVVSGFMTGIGVIILITQIFPLVGYVPTNDEELIQEFTYEAEAVILDKILLEEAGEKILVLENYEEAARRGQAVTQDEVQAEAKRLVRGATGGVKGTLRYLGRGLNHIDWLELGLALATILIIYGFKKITTKIPSTLVALLAVSITAFAMQLDVRTIRDIGEIPLGFPPLQLGILEGFSLGAITPYLGTAITLAMLGAIDSLLTSVVADNITKTRHDSNRELIGQGIGNSVSALFGGIPGAGATIRTVVNINSGGKTRLSGIFHGVVLLVILLFLGPIASSIPLAVLAGILFTVGIGVMDYKGLKAIPKMPKSDVFVMLVVLGLTVFVDLIQAVAAGLVLAALMFMKKMGDVTADRSRGEAMSKGMVEKSWPDETIFPDNLKEEVFIKHLNGPLFFGYTSEFQAVMSQIPPTTSHLIIRMGKVPYIDQSGLFALEDVLIDLTKRGVTVLLTGVQEQPRYRLESIDIIPDLIPKEHVFPDFRSCVQWISTNVSNRFGPARETV